MTDEEEFAARSQLKWTREGDAWILLYRRRRTGRVVPDKNHPGMWRSVKVDGILSETANKRAASPPGKKTTRRLAGLSWMAALVSRRDCGTWAAT